MDIAIKSHADPEVIKHCRYEVSGMDLKSQFVISSSEFPINESNTQFAVKNFDRKIMTETKQGAKMTA